MEMIETIIFVSSFILVFIIIPVFLAYLVIFKLL